jgi:hypothetical protein
MSLADEFDRPTGLRALGGPPTTRLGANREPKSVKPLAAGFRVSTGERRAGLFQFYRSLQRLQAFEYRNIGIVPELSWAVKS